MVRGERWTYLNTWEEKSKFVRGVLRIILEEAAGEVLALDEDGEDTLRETNEDDRGELPLFAKPLFGNHGGLQPRYLQQLGLQHSPQSKLGVDSPLRARRRPSDRVPIYDRQKSSDEEDIVYEDGSVEDTRTRITTAQNRPTRSAAGRVVVIVDNTQRDQKQSSSDAKRNTGQGQPSTESWEAGAERLMVQPAKEKAASQIEAHLKSWLNGDLDEDTFEKSFRSSLSDVRLSRRMQDALSRSNSSTPFQDRQNTRKRRADQLEE
ncbi:hypothetical protein H2200_010367 [Cladophialophora chaetospira]|uniref:Uncharacterized protein n=1 Tax=Cladophialophora chaetospira TaxID=386627 RepID=A0AA38X1E4_9EURO|nr:hypothetical protein H2200_010367 [Cladophialophora chaetospira]